MGLRVQRAFTGDDQIGLADALREAGSLREYFKTSFRPGAGESHQSETEAAGGTSARSLGEIKVVLLFQNLAEAAKAFFGEGNIGGAQAFLRSIDAGAAAGTEEGIGDIDGDGEAKFQAVDGREDAMELKELRPVGEFAAM